MNNPANSLVWPQLQPFSATDWPTFQALFTSSQVMQFIRPPLTSAQAKATFNKIFLQSAIEYFLVTLPNNMQGEKPYPIGLASYQPNQKNHTAEIGRMLLPQWQNQGFGSHISQLLILRAQQDHAIQQITKRIHKDNILAIRSAHSRGFTLQSALTDDFLHFSRLLIEQPNL